MSQLQNIINSTNRKMASKSAPILESMYGVKRNYRAIQWTITISVMVWVGWMTWMMVRKDIDEKESNRYYQLHKVWFGHTPVLFIFFQIWIFTILFYLVLPVFKQIYSSFKFVA
jgi:steroid 5-alpha reductase family enzyme